MAEQRRVQLDMLTQEEIDAIVAEAIGRHTTRQYKFKTGDEVIDCKGKRQRITEFVTKDIVYLSDGSTCSVSQCLKKVDDGVE